MTPHAEAHADPRSRSRLDASAAVPARGRRHARRTREVHSSAELMEQFLGTAADAPMCFTCGTKMRPAGSCYVCEGCGSTSGCS